MFGVGDAVCGGGLKTPKLATANAARPSLLHHRGELLSGSNDGRAELTASPDGRSSCILRMLIIHVKSNPHAFTAYDPAVIGGVSSRHLPGRVVAPRDEPHVRGECV